VQHKYPPRPRWNHKEVKAAVAVEYADEVRDWATSHAVLDTEAKVRELLALLTLALYESPDAYHAGRYLEDFIGWPVNGDLIRILDKAYRRMAFATTPFVMRWVAKNNVKFGAVKGDQVKARIGEIEVGGTITDVVVKEARGFMTLPGNDRILNVNAEEIFEIVEPKKRVNERRKTCAPDPDVSA